MTIINNLLLLWSCSKWSCSICHCLGLVRSLLSIYLFLCITCYLYIGIGVYILSTRSSLANNSIIPAHYYYSNQRTIPKFICLSGSSSATTAQLIGINGRDITERVGDPFITDNSGVGSLEVQGLGSFTPDYEGVYSCRLPDEHGAMVEFSFGIYLSRSKWFIYTISSGV